MSNFHPSQLQQAVEQHLRGLGYEICGDEDRTGWYWSLGSFVSTTAKLPFDTIEEATANAVVDLVERTQDLVAAAQQVVRRWDGGDLAAAVRELDLSIGYLVPTVDELGHAGAEEQERAVGPALHLVAAGPDPLNLR